MHAITTQDARQGHRRRCLSEMWLEVFVDLDRPAPVSVVTDIAVLSQALERLAAGGRFSLELACEGGPCADARLVVEDCGLELGAALREALGNGPRGARHDTVLALDDTRASVVIDFAAEPGARVADAVKQLNADGLPSGLIGVFFESLGRALGALIEIDAVGHDAPRMIAATFTGVGEALRGAIRAPSGRRPGSLSRQ